MTITYKIIHIGFIHACVCEFVTFFDIKFRFE